MESDQTLSPARPLPNSDQITIKIRSDFICQHRDIGALRFHSISIEFRSEFNWNFTIIDPLKFIDPLNYSFVADNDTLKNDDNEWQHRAWSPKINS